MEDHSPWFRYILCHYLPHFTLKMFVATGEYTSTVIMVREIGSNLLQICYLFICSFIPIPITIFLEYQLNTNTRLDMRHRRKAGSPLLLLLFLLILLVLWIFCPFPFSLPPPLDKILSYSPGCADTV